MQADIKCMECGSVKKFERIKMQDRGFIETKDGQGFKLTDAGKIARL